VHNDVLRLSILVTQLMARRGFHDPCNLLNYVDESAIAARHSDHTDEFIVNHSLFRLGSLK
jgi:hypothetical protein